jgi:hypothetical protein
MFYAEVYGRCHDAALKRYGVELDERVERIMMNSIIAAYAHDRNRRQQEAAGDEGDGGRHDNDADGGGTSLFNALSHAKGADWLAGLRLSTTTALAPFGRQGSRLPLLRAPAAGVMLRVPGRFRR